ncbi:MAG: hypothetical protein WCZ23_02690 [Rhodospirillaceae bacterium]
MARHRLSSLAVAAVALFALAACEESPGAAGSIAPGAEYQDRVLAACQKSLLRLDCGCFWDKAQPALTKANVDPILAALRERETYGNAITRSRLEKVAGQENSRIIGRALFDCVKR